MVDDRRKARGTPKGRQVDDAALARLRDLLGDAPRRRDLLIEHLHRVQDAEGHISAAMIRALSEEMRMAEAEVYEVATFYHHFDVVPEGAAPPPPLTIRVCDSLSCQLAGADALAEALTAGTDPAAVRIQKVPCVGRCDTAPVAQVGKRWVDRATPEAVLATPAGPAELPAHEDLAAYLGSGGYFALQQFRRRGEWERIQGALLEAGLRGLGGAGFPSGKKWGFVRAEPGPRLLAVNADEGEPGTFKDRHCLETRPHLVLEGMLIAAWAIEAETCYIYLRDEYPAVHAILTAEIAALEAEGLIAPGYVQLRRGAGAYICGEESAMIESLEGKRGLPRHRPPYVAQVGLFGRPTLVHNVETLHWVTRILREGEEVFVKGRRTPRRMRFYSVSGRVARPGVKLAPGGITLRELIDTHCGGMADGHELGAFQPGGPSAGLLPASLADIPLDFDVLAEHGTFIGSAAIVVLGATDSPHAAARGMLQFFAHESCGQCTPCRVGCAKAVALMSEDTWNTDLLEELATVMADASICGLGQAAANPIRLVLRHWDCR